VPRKSLNKSPESTRLQLGPLTAWALGRYHSVTTRVIFVILVGDPIEERFVTGLVAQFRSMLGGGKTGIWDLVLDSK
jgi:hypothetical protein